MKNKEEISDNNKKMIELINNLEDEINSLKKEILKKEIILEELNKKIEENQ